MSTDYETILESKRSNMKVIDFETNTESRIYLYKEDFEMFTPFILIQLEMKNVMTKLKVAEEE
ncbi:MAG TPA: hypothetical protein VE307_10485 [Nitrososphaeraceae archaeon]|nr:hypothetical protein [Nitrososphaeraceae archaeon]